MEHKGLRVTRDILKKKKLTKSIDEVMSIHYGHYRSNFTLAERYFVPYKMVRTEDLIKMMRDLTIFTRFMEYLKTPTPKLMERVAYLNLLKDYVGVDMTELEMEGHMSLIRNQEFLDNQDKFFKIIKDELNTREHIPNKIEKKIIRKSNNNLSFFKIQDLYKAVTGCMML